MKTEAARVGQVVDLPHCDKEPLHSVREALSRLRELEFVVLPQGQPREVRWR